MHGCMASEHKPQAVPLNLLRTIVQANFDLELVSVVQSTR